MQLIGIRKQQVRRIWHDVDTVLDVQYYLYFFIAMPLLPPLLHTFPIRCLGISGIPVVAGSRHWGYCHHLTSDFNNGRCSRFKK